MYIISLLTWLSKEFIDPFQALLFKILKYKNKTKHCRFSLVTLLCTHEQFGKKSLFRWQYQAKFPIDLQIY